MANPVGRPSKYRPEYCETVIELGKIGASVVEMAGTIGVARSTLENEWPVEYPDFSVAFTQAKQLCQIWWEKVGRENLLTPKEAGTFQAGMWSRNMAARFPADWREKQQLEHSGEVAVTAVARTIVDPKAE